MGKAAERILRNFGGTRAALRGTGPEALRVHLVGDIDVRALRRRLRMTQAAFAARFAVELRTVQNREQGQRRPEGPARVLLQVIDREPEAVMRALRAAV